MRNLTDKRISEIIRESLNRLVSEGHQLAFDIDIRDIDIEDLRAGYKDFRLVPSASIKYGNPLYMEATIKEAIGDILPPDKVCEEIVRKYDIPKTLVLRRENFHGIYVYVIAARIGANCQLIEEDMKKVGYYLSVIGDTQRIEGMDFNVLQFEPTSQLQEDITDDVKQRFTTLYHWTPSHNVDNIMANGLMPNHHNTKFNYPPRIYLIEGDASDEELYYLGQELCIANTDDKNDGIYTIINVDTNTMDDSIRLFYDPNCSIGIYTEQTIPNNCLREGKTIKFLNRLKTISDKWLKNITSIS